MRGRVLLTMIVLQTVVVFSAEANPIPDPMNSITPACLRICPEGDLAFEVKVRDSQNMPMSGSPVRVIFSPDANDLIFWCDTQSHPVIEGITDYYGEVTFNIAAGGCFEGGNATIYIEADPGAVALNAYERIGSTDLYSTYDELAGDGEVNLLDFVVFSAKFLTTDYCADYHDSTPDDLQCDEDVDLDDFVVFFRHYLDACQ